MLEMIKEGLISVEIAKNLNLKKSHVSYYVRKGKKLGLIKEIVKDSVTILELTQAGKNLLDQYDKNQLSVPICRAENIRFKAPVIKMPTIPLDWKRIQMHNWSQYTSQIDTVKVKLNIGNNPSIELLPSPVEGDNPFELYAILRDECYNVISELEDKIGLKVGKLQSGSRGEWLIYDPIAREFCKKNGQVKYEGIAKVNASKPRNIGEFEFHDPRALNDYLLMPHRLKNIEDMVRRVLELYGQKESLEK